MNLFPTGKCSDPTKLTNTLVLSYIDPAREGLNITFACPPGQILNGSNTSTCMGNGEWRPDPGEVECTGEYICHTFMIQDMTDQLRITSRYTNNYHHFTANECSLYASG
jgi:hypothetical protein